MDADYAQKVIPHRVPQFSCWVLNDMVVEDTEECYAIYHRFRVLAMKEGVEEAIYDRGMLSIL